MAKAKKSGKTRSVPASAKPFSPPKTAPPNIEASRRRPVLLALSLLLLGVWLLILSLLAAWK